jgi:hypothetical protein
MGFEKVENSLKNTRRIINPIEGESHNSEQLKTT